MNSLVEHTIEHTQTYILEEESHCILIHLPIKQDPFLAPAAASIQQLEDKLAASRSLLIIVEEEIFWPEAQRSYKNIKLALWENLPHLHPPPPPGPIHTELHTEYTQNTHSCLTACATCLSFTGVKAASQAEGLEYDVMFMISHDAMKTQ